MILRVTTSSTDMIGHKCERFYVRVSMAFLPMHVLEENCEPVELCSAFHFNVYSGLALRNHLKSWAAPVTDMRHHLVCVGTFFTACSTMIPNEVYPLVMSEYANNRQHCVVHLDGIVYVQFIAHKCLQSHNYRLIMNYIRFELPHTTTMALMLSLWQPFYFS